MKMALRTWRPASSWMTTLLLTLVVGGFGLFAQHRVDARTQGLSPVRTTVIMVKTAHISPQERRL